MPPVRMRSAAWLPASLVIGALLSAGCGRAGLDDFDDPDADVELDGDVPDTSVLEDVPPLEDTFFDTSPIEDTFAFDTGEFDTTVPDTTVFDTAVFDTAVFDTAVFDTAIFDTAVVDTTVPDTGPFDTGVVDTGPFDTGPDAPGDGGILCGGALCNPATQECCARFSGISCVAKGTCGGGTTLECSSAASCGPGQICCFGGFGGGGAPSATCTTSTCFGVQLCATSAECSAPQTCQPLFAGYRTCR